MTPPRDVLERLDHAQRLAAQHGFVRALARRLVAPWAADDVAQEVLIAGLEHPPREPSALRSWLTTATRHLASKWQRGEGRRAARERAVAQHEALPSTHELVERVELGQQLVRCVLALGEPERTTLLLRFHEGLTTAEIAARVGLPADTVRSRLRRGLALLRARLDERYGEHAWTPLLLPLAGWKSVAEATAVAGTTGGVALTATGGVMAGAAVMAAKGWIVGGLATATLVVAGVGTSSSWLPLVGGRATEPRIEQPQAANGPGAADFGALPQPVDAVAAQREAVAREAGGDGVVAPVLPPAGTVKLLVVDRDTGATLESDVSIRFLSEKRFAAHDGGGSVEASLTAGRWSARVQARGYEPADVDAFEVVAGTPKELGPIALARGNGVIEGDVVARHLGGAEPVVVELRGLGRRRCDACAARAAGQAQDDPRHGCGDGDEPTWHRLEGERRFRFDGLAEGSYFLRAFDPQQRLVDLRRIDLARGGYLWQVLEVSAPTSARFELRHSRGALFQGDWQGFHSESPAPITFEFLRGEQVVARAELAPSPDDVRLSVGAPALLLAKDGNGELAQVETGEYLHAEIAEQLLSQLVRVETSVTFGELNVRWAAAGSDDRLDRERMEGDTLLFDVPVPALDAVPLQVVKLRPDSFELAPLPREQLTVKVRCGGYESDPIAIDLRFGEPLPTVIALHPSAARLEELAWLALGQPDSCTKCHEQRRDNGSSMIWSNIEISFGSEMLQISGSPTPEGGSDE